MCQKRWLLSAAWLGLSLLGTSCGEQGEQPKPLWLSAFRQAGERNVYLNEPLVLDFRQDLNPLSVNVGSDGQAGSLRVLDPLGLPVDGSLEINGRQLVFRARLPLLPDLSDGGFRPGTVYHIELMGFPRPDGIRSRSGAPLERSLSLGFRTSLSGGPQPLFDPFLELGGGAARMLLEGKHIAPGEPMRLVSTYSIDPRSLGSGEFALTFWDDLEGLQPASRVALLPRLTENQALTAGGGQAYLARLELVPERALRTGRYVLTRVGRGLRTLSGRELAMAIPMQGVQIEVGLPAEREHRWRFGDSRNLGFGEAAGAAGSLWRDVGESGVSLHLLRAAGDGHRGLLSAPEQWPGGGEFQAQSVELASGSSLDLSERTGCVVLRCQGAMELAGSIRRRLPEGSAWATPGRLARPLARQEALSDWIERMQLLGEPWTILVAGADLKLSGEIDVEGPLLLVAGGALRVRNGARVRSPLILKSPYGGSNLGQVRDLPWVLDSVRVNPLKKPLSYGLLTRPFRPEGGLRRWTDIEVDAELGSTRLELEFIGLRDRPDGGLDEVGPVSSLDQLVDCQGIRLLLFLTAPAADGDQSAWSRPSIRGVRLRWIPEAP